MKTALVMGKRNKCLDNAIEGFKKIGYCIVECDNKLDIPVCDIGIVRGVKSRSKKRMLAKYFTEGRPVAVLECGYFKRATANTPGYSQLNIHSINMMPTVYDSTRWEKLELEILESKSRCLAGGVPILMAGQVPDDAQHMYDEFQLARWYHTVGCMVEQELRCRVVFRPHPVHVQNLAKVGKFIDDVWPEIDSSDEPFESVIQKYSGLITYNSTAGCEALRIGMGVLCGQNCHYAHLSSPFLESASLYSRTQHLHRLAYAQWHNDELATGEPQEYWEGQVRAWQAGELLLPEMWTRQLEEWQKLT